MFEHERLAVYQKVRDINKELLSFLTGSKFDSFLKDHLKRSSLSVALNIAEGAGRFSKNDKKHFLLWPEGL